MRASPEWKPAAARKPPPLVGKACGRASAGCYLSSCSCCCCAAHTKAGHAPILLPLPYLEAIQPKAALPILVFPRTDLSTHPPHLLMHPLAHPP
jgi:hypothetical protein